MRKLLEELLLDSVQSVAGVSPSAFLAVRYPSLIKVMQFAEQTPQAAYAATKFRAIFARQNWILDSTSLESFFQLAGEVQFWMLAAHRGLALERIPETDFPTADFQLMRCPANSMCFEVKTLSVSGGWRALAKMAEDSYEAQLRLHAQSAQGQRIAITESSVAPHGSLPRQLQQTTVCRHLIDKTLSNIKAGQFSTAPTFLVLNLMLIDGVSSDSSDLRPVAPGYPHDWSVRTGALWTLAFGSMGQLVHGNPEFEGLPGVEGRLEREGVLVHPDHKSVAGLLLVLHRLNADPIRYGLIRHADAQLWESQNPKVLEDFHALVASNWNDDRDSNSSQLTSRSA